MRNLEIDQFLDFISLSNLQTSLNGETLSYTRTKMSLKKNEYRHRLYLYDGARNHKSLKLKKDFKYFWESSNTILFFREKTKEEKALKKEKHTIVYRYNIDDKSETVAYDFPLPVSSIEVIDETSLLVYTSLNEAEHAYFEDDEVRLNFIEQDKYNEEFEEFEAIPIQRDGGSFTRNRNSQIFLYKEGKYVPLGSKDETLSLAFLSNDRTKVIYTYQKNTNKPSYYADIRVFDLNSETYTNITENSGYSFSKLFELNDKIYFLGSDKLKYGMNQNGDFYEVSNDDISKVVDFGYSSNSTVGSDVRYGPLNTTVTHDNKYYFVGSKNHHTIIYEFDGVSVKEYRKSESSIDAMTFYKNDLYTIEINADKLQELYKNGNRITNFNEEILLNTYIAKPIHHAYKRDNETLDGWVLLPKDFELGKSYPSILDIHGGPKTIYSTAFYNEMQVWANLGYVVYFTNPRGSDCGDNEFMDIRGKYGSGDFDDLMHFTDLVVKEYQLDESRMGVTGGSYGGFMTNWIVSHTDRFSAAATQRSISNWISFAGTSDIGSYFAKDQTAADTLNDVEIAWNQSPLKYADNIKTPLLFIHSDADYRCPMEQGLQLYTRVKMNDVESKFIYFKNENHDLSRSGKPKARLKRLTEITNWMNLHLNK